MAFHRKPRKERDIIQDSTIEVLERAGYKIFGQERTYRPTINDSQIELKILRPQEIPYFVGEGLQDAGITGLDWIRETRAQVKILLNLEYGGVKVIIAIPKAWNKINSLSELFESNWRRGKNVRISTEYLNNTAEYVMANPIYKKTFKDAEPLVITPWWKRGVNPKVSIFLSFGATEAKPPESADAIVDATETGTTLVQNNLKVIEIIMESSAVFITNEKALNDPEKREKIFDILTLLKGVVDGRKKIHIFVNVKKENLDELLNTLPALKKPTISPLSEDKWYSVNTIINKDYFLELLPILRKLAQGLVVHEPRQILPLEGIKEGKEDEKAV
ncbi:MAG: ATP phosphoribosyltransferase [Candidatus Hermodarchaeota archaeon]